MEFFKYMKKGELKRFQQVSFNTITNLSILFEALFFILKMNRISVSGELRTHGTQTSHISEFTTKIVT